MADTKTTVKKVKEAEVVEKTTIFKIMAHPTEKCYAESMKRTYIFAVPLASSKQQIAKAIADEFKVTVEGVRVLTRKGKKTKYSKGKHQYPGTTFRRDHKFAYITVKEGDKIPMFEEEKTEEPKDDQKPKKTEKANKADKKDDKKGAK